MIERISDWIRTAANLAGVQQVYFGRIGDYNLFANNGADTVPVLVIEPPTGGSAMLAANAKQDDVTLKLFMLTADQTTSGYDAVLENDGSVPAREVLIGQMDQLMTDFVWYLNGQVINGGQRMTTPTGLTTYDQYTDRVLAGVSRSITIRIVTVNCA